MSENHECLWASAGVGCADHWRSDKQDWIGEFICKTKTKKGKSPRQNLVQPSWEQQLGGILQERHAASHLFFSEVPLWLALSLEKGELVFMGWSPRCSGHYYYTVTFCSLLHHPPRASRQHTQVTLCPERGGGVLQTWLTFSLKRDPKYFLKHFQSHVFILSGLIVYSSDLNPFQSVRGVLSHAKFLQDNFADCIFKEKTFVVSNHSIGPLR